MSREEENNRDEGVTHIRKVSSAIFYGKYCKIYAEEKNFNCVYLKSLIEI